MISTPLLAPLFFLAKTWALLGLCGALAHFGHSQKQPFFEMLALTLALLLQISASYTFFSNGGVLHTFLKNRYPEDREWTCNPAQNPPSLGWFLLSLFPIGFWITLGDSLFPNGAWRSTRKQPLFQIRYPWLILLVCGAGALPLAKESIKTLLHAEGPFPSSSLQSKDPKANSGSPAQAWGKFLFWDPITTTAIQVLKEGLGMVQSSTAQLKTAVEKDPVAPESQKTWEALPQMAEELFAKAKANNGSPPRGTSLLFSLQSALIRPVLEYSPNPENPAASSVFLSRLLEALDSSIRVHELSGEQPTSLKRTPFHHWFSPPAASVHLVFQIFEKVLNLRTLSTDAQLIEKLIEKADALILLQPAIDQPVLHFQLESLRGRWKKSAGGILHDSLSHSLSGKLLKVAFDL